MAAKSATSVAKGARVFVVTTRPQSGNFGVFGLSALSQENELIFAREREKIFLEL